MRCMLKGNIDALRDLVQQKFQSPKPVVKVKTRFCTKKPDAYGVFAAHVAMKMAKTRAVKKPAASGPVVTDGGWTVSTVVRAGGATAGLSDKHYTSPEGRTYRSAKQAKLAGYVS